MKKKFISSMKKVVDRSRLEEQNYVKAVLFLFLESYLVVLEEKGGRARSEGIKSMVQSAEEELSERIELGIDDSGLIREHIVEYIRSNLDEIDGMTLGKLYQDLTSSAYKKKMGQVYTPQYIIDHMIETSISETKLVENPHIKVLDPSCGSGYFLVAIYRKLMEVFRSNRESIVGKNPEFLGLYEAGISKFIVKNLIYGVEKDSFSSNLSKIALALETGLETNNVVCGDMLTDKYDIKVDMVIGNPPYIGTKSLDRDYRQRLREAYPEVYEDKSDISYCFFQRANEILSDGGELNIISSRYMMEAHHAKKLRAYIDREYDIESIIDFYGENVFKGASVSPAIFKFRKSHKSNKFKYGRVKREKGSRYYEEFGRIELFEIDRDRLSADSWIMEPESIYKIYSKIDQSGDIAIGKVSDLNQGIITGCDRAFVIEGKGKLPECERDILVSWIKNSDVRRYGVEESSKFLIALEKNKIERYQAIRSHLESYRYRLESRRECKLGSKMWYELQWARDKSKFVGKRIIFPYKASSNRFALVEDELYHSADVYSLRLRDEYRKCISEEYLLGYLNSSLFEFYFKIVAKKVGSDLYEYYPNRLARLNLKLKDDGIVEGLVEKIIGSSSERLKADMSKEVDDYFFNIYGISDEERKLIEGYIKDA